MPRKVRLGSALESTTRARISVPSSRTTPRTRPSRESICWTAALVRISAPKPRAALACSVEALFFVLAAAEEMKEQAEGGARLVRASVFAVDVVGEEQRFYFFGFVIAVEELA